MYFSFIEYICIIDVFTYFDSTASVVKGGIYVLPQHTEQLPNESLSSFALKHQRMIMTALGRWWIQFILRVQGCTVNCGTVSHHSGELASTWGFYAITTSLSLYFISSECQFTVFSKEFTPFLVTSITSSSFQPNETTLHWSSVFSIDYTGPALWEEGFVINHAVMLYSFMFLQKTFLYSITYKSLQNNHKKILVCHSREGELLNF